MNTKIMTAGEAVRLLVKTNPEVLNDAWYPTLFGGDRLSCCDEAVVIEVDNKMVSLATIAPDGEMTDGKPTIVGLYTVRAFRKKGHGKVILSMAIGRCIERGFKKIHIDVLTPKAMKIVQSLQKIFARGAPEILSTLVVNDQTMFGGFLD